MEDDISSVGYLDRVIGMLDRFRFDGRSSEALIRHRLN
jgi:hypothetical protein